MKQTLLNFLVEKQTCCDKYYIGTNTGCFENIVTVTWGEGRRGAVATPS